MTCARKRFETWQEISVGTRGRSSHGCAHVLPLTAATTGPQNSDASVQWSTLASLRSSLDY